MVKPIAEIAVNAPLNRLFHYEVPVELGDRLERGHRVLVPFGRRTTTGVCVGFPEESEVTTLKPIREILHPDCRFDEHVLRLTRWIARYYFASWGEVLEAALPPGIRAGKNERFVHVVRVLSSAEALLEESARVAKRAPAQSRLLEYLAGDAGPHPRPALLQASGATSDALRRLAERGFVEIVRERVDPLMAPTKSSNHLADPTDDDADAPTPPQLELHEDQDKALRAIDEALDLDADTETAPLPILLHGVTGSGKTEVYLRALDRVVREGGRGLVLVPEISLTPQTVRRFREGLPGVRLAVQHSMLGARARTEQWRDIQAGQVDVVIGARSAIFAPVPDLRLIVVDEEHEPSYKQESSPRYNGRDVAVMRANMLRIPIVLGSATPSLESYHNARTGRYRLLEMPRRATPHDLPTVSMVPLGKEFYSVNGSGLVSGPLDHQIRQCLKRKEQTILFLNRRGFSTYLHCPSCGFVFKCISCDIALTYHRGEHALRCHYCDARQSPPSECPECTFRGLRRSGVGTEKVAELLSNQFPDARVGRLDRDSVKNDKSLRAILDDFSRGDIDILVGTQMIAKGHDFPRVSLVGVITADTGLHFPDFRAAERTFQIITQVSGRAGRGENPGKVVVQSFSPDHYAIDLAVQSDYRAFYEREVDSRQTLAYPPFGRIAKVLVQSEREERARKLADDIAARLRTVTSSESISVLGPAASPIARIQDRHRFQILVKAANARDLGALLRQANVQAGGRTTAEVVVDVDPQSML